MRHQWSAIFFLHVFTTTGAILTGCVRVASFPGHERTLVLTQLSVFRPPASTSSYWLFVFFPCSLAQLPTRNKPLFSLAILVWFRLSWTWQNCSSMGMFDCCYAQRPWNQTPTFPYMGWQRFICLPLPPEAGEWRFPPPTPNWNKTNSSHISSLVSFGVIFIWCFPSPSFLSFSVPLVIFSGFVSLLKPSHRDETLFQLWSQSPTAQGLLCVPYIRQPCWQTQGFWCSPAVQCCWLVFSLWLIVTPALYFCTAAS